MTVSIMLYSCSNILCWIISTDYSFVNCGKVYECAIYVHVLLYISAWKGGLFENNSQLLNTTHANINNYLSSLHFSDDQDTLF